MKYSGPYLIAGIIVLLVLGQSFAANGQTVTIASHVVVNEIELNPNPIYGDDTKLPTQWVELYNPTNSPVSIGGWTIGATSGLKQVYTIPQGTTLSSQQFVVYHYVPLWFPHAGAIIQLKSSNGTIVDQTPSLSDTQGDGNTWQRMYDGYSTSSLSDWVYKLGTPGSSNGQPPTASTVTKLTMSITSDKQGYVFGDMVNINGQVSQIVKDPAVSSIPQSVNIVLSGPQGFKKTFMLYPGNDLKFSTYFKTDQVLGFSEGTYTISASYGDVLASSTFSLGSEAFVPPAQSAPLTMSISTDSSNYTVSQPIVLLGTVSKVLPLTPVQYKVYDPGNVIVYQGTLFPDSQGKITSANQYQRSAGSSGLLINSVNPVYGIYRVTATYGDATAFTTFTLVSTQAQSNVITLSTDKQVYAPGETVVLKGSTLLKGLQNLGLSPNLQVIQTTVGGSSGTQSLGNRGIVPNTVNISTQVNLQSDNTFTYKLSLVGTSDGLGNYRAIISIPQGTAEADFVVVQNPSGYQPTTSSQPFSIFTDKASYALGEPITISGKILNPIQISTQNAGASVKVLVYNSTGGAVTSGGSFINNAGVSTSNALSYFAFPDANGNFKIQQIVQTGIYSPGTYVLRASYSNLASVATFSVYNPLETGTQNPINASTDKKVYGVGETVQLTGKVSSSVDTSSFTLTLVKPDGEQAAFPLAVSNGMFSWSWAVPTNAKTGTSPITIDRSSSPVLDPTINLYGIYRVKISSGNANADLFFQVSKNPQPNQDIEPIVVMTDKTSYVSTDVAKIWGEVIPVQNAASQDAVSLVQVLIYSSDGQQVYRGDATVNQGGQYYVTVPFHTGIWKTGTYKLYVQYSTNRAISSFNVTDQFSTTSTKLSVFMTTDTDKYLPGQTVLITGRTSYIISVNSADLGVGLANDTIISEGQAMSKKGYVIPKITVPFDQYGSFSYDYKIPANAPLGNYTVVAQVPFGAYNAYFSVVDKLPVQQVPVPQNQTSTPAGNQTSNATQAVVPAPLTIGPTQKRSQSADMFVEKNSKLSESVIAVDINSKAVGGTTYHPKEIDGLLRVNPGDVNSVGLKVSAQDGTCVIGQDSGCLVTGSTVQSGMLYKTVTVGGMDYLVGYSGGGMRVEQFSIVPAHTGDVIPDGQWGVEIIKKDQVTRFYYQVTYSTK